MISEHPSQAIQERRVRRLLLGLILFFLVGFSCIWLDSYRNCSELAIGFGTKNRAKVVMIADSGRVNVAYGTAGGFKTGVLYESWPSENGARYAAIQESRSRSRWHAVEFSFPWLIALTTAVYAGVVLWLNERGRRISASRLFQIGDPGIRSLNEQDAEQDVPPND